MKDFAGYGSGPLETKDADPETKQVDTAEIKGLLDANSKLVKQFMDKTEAEMAEMKKSMDGKTADVVTQDELKKMNDGLDEFKKQVESLRLANQRPMLTAPDGTKATMTEEQIEHKKAFGQFFRKGKGLEELQEIEKKTLSVGSDPDGGVVVPVEMEQAIDRVVTETSNIRALARVVQVSTASYKKRVGMGGATSGWVGEKTSRPETETPTIEELEFPVMELYAQPGATQSLLDDAAINIDQWLADEVAIEFAVQEGAAFVNGDGASKPRGFMAYDKVENDSWEWGKVGYVGTGEAGGFATGAGEAHDNLIDLIYSIKQAFRGGSRFMMNDKTVSVVRKIKDTEGNPLWTSGLREGEPDRLAGYALTTIHDMPDVANNAYAIAFGNLQRAYTIVDRIGTRVLRDPFTAKPYVLFYTTKRTGGGISHFEPLKLLRFAA